MIISFYLIFLLPSIAISQILCYIIICVQNVRSVRKIQTLKKYYGGI